MSSIPVDPNGPIARVQRALHVAQYHLTNAQMMLAFDLDAQAPQPGENGTPFVFLRPAANDPDQLGNPANKFDAE